MASFSETARYAGDALYDSEKRLFHVAGLLVPFWNFYLKILFHRVAILITQEQMLTSTTHVTDQ